MRPSIVSTWGWRQRGEEEDGEEAEEEELWRSVSCATSTFHHLEFLLLSLPHSTLILAIKLEVMLNSGSLEVSSPLRLWTGRRVANISLLPHHVLLGYLLVRRSCVHKIQQETYLRENQLSFSWGYKWSEPLYPGVWGLCPVVLFRPNASISNLNCSNVF